MDLKTVGKISSNQPLENQAEAPLSFINPNVDKKILLSVHVSSILRYITNSICTSFDSLKNCQVGSSLKVILPLRIPFSILNIFQSAENLKNASKNEKIDETLNIVSEAGTIMDVVATATDGFATVGATAANVAVWTLPLFGVGFGLQAAGLALTTKNLIETHKFSKTFQKSAQVKEKVENYGLNYFKSSKELIEKKCSKEKRFVKKHFGISNEKLCARLEKVSFKAERVFAENDESRKQKYQAKMKNTVMLLDKRMKVIKQSRAFSIFATFVGVAGVAAVLASPAAPVGFALLGISAALELGHFFKMRSVTKLFEKEMKLK